MTNKTHGERIERLETIIEIEIPDIRSDIGEIKDILNTKNGHKNGKWLNADAKDFIIRWGMRAGIGSLVGKSIYDAIPK